MSNKQESKKSAEEIERYWTPERKAKAKLREFKPTPAPKPDPAPVTPEGKQLDIPGHNPDEKEGDKGASPAAPENAAPVTNPTQYPWRTVGKLYFIAGGIDYVGTAYSIYTNTLLTAAHNLYKDGVWSEILYFVPALLSTGVEPFGHWTYYRETVMPDWMNNQSPAYDVGTVWLNVGGNTNQPIGGVVGYLGLTYNRTVPREWVDTAYPGGEMQMYADPGMYTQSYDGGRIVGKNGNLAGGASGGAWLLTGDLNSSNGIHSYSRTDTEKLSPYFRDSIAQFINDNLH